MLWCRVLGFKDDEKLQTTEIKMLHSVCGKALRNDTSNETIYEMTGVEK